MTALGIGNLISVCFGTNLLNFWFYDSNFDETGPYLSNTTAEFWSITAAVVVIMVLYVMVRWSLFTTKRKKLLQ